MFSKKECGMGFEKQVLSKVSEILDTDNLAEFYSGTLFVSCNEKHAKQIVAMLKKDFRARIGVSRAAPHEYAFDFVA